VAALASPDLARKASPADWYTQVTRGNLDRFMPPFASLSDRQRWDVVAYSFTLSVTPAQLEQGAALYQTHCLSCHGATGKGDGPSAAGLANRPKDLTDQAYIAQKSDTAFFTAISEGVAPAMPAFAGSLSEDERWAVSAYLRTFTFASTQPPGLTKPTAPAATAAGTGEANALVVTPAAPPTAPASQGTGTVSGQVTHASGQALPEGLEVLLRGFDDMNIVYTQTTSIDADGLYQFSDVEMPAGRAFLATIEYEQATYGSDIGMVEEGQLAIDLPITVYATTTDASILRADRLHLFFEFIDEKTVRVIELYIISNPTDKTLVPPAPGEASVSFSLPEGATNLEFQDGALGGRYIALPGGFGDTVSIRPGSGSYETLYAYSMPYDRKLDLKLKAPMPVDAVVILVPEGQIKLKSDQLQDGGTRDVQGIQYHTYSGSLLAAGAELAMTLTGRPKSGTPSLAQTSNTDLVIGLSVFGLALVLAGGWMYWRTRSATLEDEQEPRPMAASEPEESAETIMDAIIALDELYQAGKLPEDAYQQRRAELRSRLKELLE
jgi:mono/diheme cytochrome c family protein